MFNINPKFPYQPGDIIISTSLDHFHQVYPNVIGLVTRLGLMQGVYNSEDASDACGESITSCVLKFHSITSRCAGRHGAAV